MGDDDLNNTKLEFIQRNPSVRPNKPLLPGGGGYIGEGVKFACAGADGNKKYRKIVVVLGVILLLWGSSVLVSGMTMDCACGDGDIDVGRLY